MPADPQPNDDGQTADRRLAGLIAQLPGLSLARRPKGPVEVVCLCKDRPEVVRSFVDQQLAIGASKIHLYFDDPQDAALDWARRRSNVIPTACDDDFWASVNWQGKPQRPVHIEARQSACSTDAYSKIPSQRWAAFCDVDELFVPHEDFNALLEAVPAEIEQIKASVAEAIWLPGAATVGVKSATLARRPVPGKNAESKLLLEPLWRRRSLLFRMFSDRGVMGHVGGKALVRGGLKNIDFRIHSHKRLRPNGKPGELKTLTDGPITLLHYDALSFDIWCTKHLRRLARETAIGGNPAHRSAQSELFGMVTGEEGREGLFERFYGSDPAYLKALLTAGLLLRLDNAGTRDWSIRTNDQP